MRSVSRKPFVFTTSPLGERSAEGRVRGILAVVFREKRQFFIWICPSAFGSI